MAKRSRGVAWKQRVAGVGRGKKCNLGSNFWEIIKFPFDRLAGTSLALKEFSFIAFNIINKAVYSQHLVCADTANLSRGLV